MRIKLFKPKIDVAFKMLFGDMRNLNILIDFLSSVLSLPKEEYERIEIVDPHIKRESIDDKLGIVDVRLVTKNGKTVHIEMQVAAQEELPERITYYMSKMLAAQLKSGESYNKLEKTISIIIADFEIVSDSLEYHHIFQLIDFKTGKKFTDLLEVNTLELRKLPEQRDDTKKYDWMDFLRSEKEEEFELLAKRNPVIKEAYAVLKKLSQDEEAQLIYEAREKALRDDESRTRAAFNKGRKEREIEFINSLLKIGMPIEQIATAANMSVEEIRQLI